MRSRRLGLPMSFAALCPAVLAIAIGAAALRVWDRPGDHVAWMVIAGILLVLTASSGSLRLGCVTVRSSGLRWRLAGSRGRAPLEAVSVERTPDGALLLHVPQGHAALRLSPGWYAQTDLDALQGTFGGSRPVSSR